MDYWQLRARQEAQRKKQNSTIEIDENLDDIFNRIDAQFDAMCDDLKAKPRTDETTRYNFFR